MSCVLIECSMYSRRFLHSGWWGFSAIHELWKLFNVQFSSNCSFHRNCSCPDLWNSTCVCSDWYSTKTQRDHQAVVEFSLLVAPSFWTRAPQIIAPWTSQLTVFSPLLFPLKSLPLSSAVISGPLQVLASNSVFSCSYVKAQYPLPLNDDHGWNLNPLLLLQLL